MVLLNVFLEIPKQAIERVGNNLSEGACKFSCVLRNE